MAVTPLGVKLMGAYGLLWLLLFAATHWLPGSPTQLELSRMVGPEGFEVPTYSSVEAWELLVLQPLGAEAQGGVAFRPWQVLTAPLTYPPVGGFSSLVLGLLGFLFFAAPVERLLGTRAFLQLWAVSCFAASVGGLLVGAVLGAPLHFGFAPALLAVMVVCCMMTPEATVPFFLVLQVKLKWVAAGIAAIVVLRTLGLSGGGVAGGYDLVGMAAGWAWWRGGYDLDPRRVMHRRRARANLKLAVDRALAPQDEDDGPLFH